MTGATHAAATITAACRGCGACLLTCPERAIRPAAAPVPGTGPLAVLADRCTGCAECVEVCPADAVGISSHATREESPGHTRQEEQCQRART